MLRGHQLVLLINMHQNATIMPENATLITFINGQGNQTTLEATIEDVKAGRLAVRTIKEDQVRHQNIRHLINTLSMPEIKSHNFEIGAATTRTAMQKALAQNYTEELLNRASRIIICVDGSTNTEDNPTTTKQQKYTRTGCGGCGGRMMDETNNKPHHYFRGPVNANELRKAELKAMLAALGRMNQDHQRTNKTRCPMLCDCKSAVNYINQICTMPMKPKHNN